MISFLPLGREGYCLNYEMIYFSIGHILAIMRQWVPQTQHAIDQLVFEILKRGAHPDDRDR